MNGMLKPLGFATTAAAAAAAGSLGTLPLQPANLNPAAGLLKLRHPGLAATAPTLCTLNGQLNGLSNGLTAAAAANGLSTGAINGFSGWTTLPQL